jgi:hypothetical protein
VAAELPILIPQGKLKVEPIVVLDRRVIKKRNAPAIQILMRCSNLPDSDATWKDYLQIHQQFPEFIVEDNSNSKRENVSNDN